MRSFAAVAVFVAAANAYAYNYTQPAPEPVYTTEVVSILTTVCPGPTEIPVGTKTYTVTEATTLTITDCPCTISKPVETPVYTPAPSSAAETSIYTYPVAPAPYPSSNGTVPQPPAGPTGTAVTTTSAPPAFTGAATQAGVGLLAVAGALAAFL